MKKLVTIVSVLALTAGMGFASSVVAAKVQKADVYRFDLTSGEPTGQSVQVTFPKDEGFLNSNGRDAGSVLPEDHTVHLLPNQSARFNYVFPTGERCTATLRDGQIRALHPTAGRAAENLCAETLKITPHDSNQELRANDAPRAREFTISFHAPIAPVPTQQ